MPIKLEERCRKIELILSDVDGVLTDGSLVFDNQGIETKAFHIRDGLGIRLWQRAGFRFGVLTARTSQIVRMRAAELDIEIVRQGFENKLPAAQQIMRTMRTAAGSGVFYRRRPDRPAGDAAGRTGSRGGRRRRGSAGPRPLGHHGRRRPRRRPGSHRTVLKAKNRWDDLIRKYLEQ